jgi:arsenate reductase-like glutaredoxin family protein
MIEIYTLPNCAECVRVKVWLKDRQIPFVEHDLKQPTNREARKAWREMGLNVAPVIVCKKMGEESIVLDIDSCSEDYYRKFAD